METSAAAHDETEKTVFARKTSGLVKELGTFESFSISLISLGPGPAFGLFLTILLFVTGANLDQAVLLAALIGIPVVATYALIAIEIPRSGGEYVYASRELHPFFGILSAYGRIMNVICYAAVLPYWFMTYSIGPGLAAWGSFTNYSGWATFGDMFYPGTSSSVAQFDIVVIGVLLTLVVMILWIAMKPRLAFRVFSGLLILELVALVVSVVALAIMGHTGFVNAVNAFATSHGLGANYYATVSAYGASAWGSYGSSLRNTILFVPLVFAFYYMFGNAPSYIAGEFKRSTRSIAYGIAISFALAVAFAVAIVVVFEQVVGMNFLNGAVATSVYFIAPTGPAFSPLPFGAGPTSLPGFAFHGNTILLGLIFLGSASWYLLWLILGLYIFSRYALSMSLDRIWPRWFGNVTRSTHQPWVGIVAISIAGFILLPLMTYNYDALYTPLVFLLFFLPMITVALTALSLTALGWRRHKPVRALVGFVAFLVTAISAYLVSTLPLLGTASGFTPSNKETGAIIIVVILIASGVTYAVSRWYNQRTRGIDIGLAFKELPPD